MRDPAVKARRGGAHRATNVRWWQVVSAVVPVTLVASAWGVAITANPAADKVDATGGSQSTTTGVPAITDVPTDVFERPTAGKVQDRQSRSAPLAGISKSDATPVSLRSSPLPSASIDAYRNAAKVMSDVKASCKLDWTLIAAIGRVESNHGQYGGSAVSRGGDTAPEIIGIPLNGTNNTASISDTDKGELDGDSTWDRAVGPMQFIPSTWDLVAVDGNGDGDKNPHNVYDAALATAVYLCADGKDLSTKAGASEAVFSYNHSRDYVATVLAIAQRYGNGDFTEESSVYLPDTDPETDTFDPDVDPGNTNVDTDGNGSDGADGADGGTDQSPNGFTKLEATDFGGPETANDGKQQIQQIDKSDTSPGVGGGLLEEQHSQTGTDTVRPPNPDGTNNPDKIQGFADNLPNKSKNETKTKQQNGKKPKNKKNRLQGFNMRRSQSNNSTGSKNDNGEILESTPQNGKPDGQTKNNGSNSNLESQSGKSEGKAETPGKKSDNKAPKSGGNDNSKNSDKSPDTKKTPDTKTGNGNSDGNSGTQSDKQQKNQPKPEKKKSNEDPKPNKKDSKGSELGSINSSAEQTQLCADGADEVRTSGTKLNDSQVESLIGSCVDDFATAASTSGEDPIFTWMSAKAKEL